MKKILALALSSCMIMPMMAQPPQRNDSMPNDQDIAKFDVLVYQNPNVGDMLGKKWEEQAQALQGNSRGFFDGLIATTTGAAYTMASTGILGLASTGAAAVGNLINAKKNQKQQWRQLTAQENTFSKNLCSMEDIKDFYSEISTTGALDPSAMTFGGIGCLQTQGQDTVLYIACKLDTSDEGLSRILRHSKFQLVLDELVFNPTLCNLPNDSLTAFSERKRFSFDEKSNLMLTVDMNVTSSWINQDIEVFQDQDLGSFTLKIPIDQNSLDSNGVLRYSSAKPQAGFEVQGECFVVPRSYMGVRDEKGNYYDAWGTGQYKVNLNVMESCTNNPQMEQNDALWKADLKRRKKSSASDLKTEMLRVARQTWDAQGQQWVVTLVEAPSKYAAQELIGFMGLSGASSTSSAAAAQKAAAAAMSGATSGAGSQGAAGAQGGMSGQMPQ